MNKIQIQFENGEVLVTESQFLNGYILKGLRSGNPVAKVTDL